MFDVGGRGASMMRQSRRLSVSSFGVLVTVSAAMLLATDAVGAAVDQAVGAATIQGQLPSGAAWSAQVPEKWNGTLLLFSHGYSPVARAPELAPPSMKEALLAQGYALAASAYSSTGWALAEAVPDQIATLDAFAMKFGKPRRAIAWGASMGGLVSVALAEKYPQRIDAALPSCGSIAGSLAMMNEALDGAFAFKVLLAADSDIRLVHVDDDLINGARVESVLASAVTTPAGRARLALASAVAQLPEWSGAYASPPEAGDSERQVDEAAKTFARGVFLPRVDQERRAGGVFSWNTDVDYRAQLAASGRAAWVKQLYVKANLDLEQDLTALERAPRIAADSGAVDYMRSHYVPNGQVRVPILSYHTVGDGLTVPAQQAAYRNLAQSQGSGDEVALAWVGRAGHCNFTSAEHLAALHTLELRLDTGIWRTTPQQLNALSANEPDASKFVAFAPAPLLRACGSQQPACTPRAGIAGSAGAADLSADKSSIYVAVADATKIAIDIYKPAQQLPGAAMRWPIILLHSLGPRSDPRTMASYGVADLIKRGYVFVWMQPRGTGASFGKTGGFLTAQNGRDVRDVIAWLVKQPWSNGKVGMMGLSNLGFIQWLAAAQRPPGLVTIVPAVANPDFYYQLYPNGVSALGGAPGVASRRTPQSRPVLPDAPMQPVDGDAPPEYPLWSEAQRAHIGGLSLPDEWSVNLLRDQINPRLGYAPGLVDSPLPALSAELRSAGILIYQMGGWADASPGGQIVAHRGFGAKLIIGAWPHMLMAEDQGAALLRKEHQRWFDWTLKGIDDGIGHEPAVRYQTQNERQGDGWHFAARFPLPTQKTVAYHFAAGPTHTVNSGADAALDKNPQPPAAFAPYRVAFDIAAFGGKYNRLNRTWAGDMTDDVDVRSLTFTSPVLEEDTEVTGFPIANIWVSANQADADLIVYLEEVSADGRSRFVTDGAARASHRLIDQRWPWNEVSVPFHRSYAADRRLLKADEPVMVRFALTPTSYLFRRGSRIRFTVSGGEINTYQPPEEIDINQPLLLRVYRGGARDSRIELPVIERSMAQVQ
jgi:putative CocE/NonD family hydrolase